MQYRAHRRASVFFFLLWGSARPKSPGLFGARLGRKPQNSLAVVTYTISNFLRLLARRRLALRITTTAATKIKWNLSFAIIRSLVGVGDFTERPNERGAYCDYVFWTFVFSHFLISHYVFSNSIMRLTVITVTIYNNHIANKDREHWEDDERACGIIGTIQRRPANCEERWSPGAGAGGRGPGPGPGLWFRYKGKNHDDNDNSDNLLPVRFVIKRHS